MNDLENMAFPKKSWVKQRKKRKKHPKSILHGKQSGFCYLCALLNGDYSMKQTEEHHVVFGAGQDVYKKSGMNKETRRKIDNAIRKLEREYTIYLDRIEGEHLKNKDIFVTGGFIDKDGVLKHSLVINYDMNYEQVEMTMKKLYNKQYMAGKDYEDYIVHEMAHILPFQNCTTKREYMELTEKIRNMFVPDVSGYADKKRDGLESLAEAFVRYRNGEEIPTKAMKLIEEYIEPWRRR